jgi:excisionase family DNA binding protein
VTAGTRAVLAETLAALHKANEAIVRLAAAVMEEERPKPAAPDAPKYFTVKEAAKYTTLSTATIRKAAKERKLSHCLNGSRIIFSREQLDDFLSNAAVSSDRRLSDKAETLNNRRKRSGRF